MSSLRSCGLLVLEELEATCLADALGVRLDGSDLLVRPAQEVVASPHWFGRAPATTVLLNVRCRVEEAQPLGGASTLAVGAAGWHGCVLVSQGPSQAVGTSSSGSEHFIPPLQKNRTQLVVDHLSSGAGTQLEDRSFPRFGGAGHAPLPRMEPWLKSLLAARTTAGACCCP